jgi:hypothetical protein
VPYPLIGQGFQHNLGATHFLQHFSYPYKKRAKLAADPLRVNPLRE